MGNGLEQLGWRVPSNVKERFKEHCDSVGLQYQASLAAAMLFYLRLPPTLQHYAALEVSGNSPIDDKFWKEYIQGFEKAIADHLRSRNKRH